MAYEKNNDLKNANKILKEKNRFYVNFHKPGPEQRLAKLELDHKAKKKGIKKNQTKDKKSLNTGHKSLSMAIVEERLAVYHKKAKNYLA